MPTPHPHAYPIGTQHDEPFSRERLPELIEDIATLPARVRAAIAGWSAERLDTPYRDGGWTVRQVVHHLVDSHMNAYVRMRLALTEDTPTIRPYDEQRWAELPDAKSGPVEMSLALLEALHVRWVALLRACDAETLRTRAYLHPELGEVPLERAVAMYSWHGRHHLAHIVRLAERMGWRDA